MNILFSLLLNLIRNNLLCKLFNLLYHILDVILFIVVLKDVGILRLFFVSIFFFLKDNLVTLPNCFGHWLMDQGNKNCFGFPVLASWRFEDSFMSFLFRGCMELKLTFATRFLMQRLISIAHLLIAFVLRYNSMWIKESVNVRRKPLPFVCTLQREQTGAFLFLLLRAMAFYCWNLMFLLAIHIYITSPNYWKSLVWLIYCQILIV